MSPPSPADEATTLNVTEPTPGDLVVAGQIAAGGGPVLRVWEVDHPSQFARTAFIEALRRAGVTVTAPTTGTNPTGLLPARGSYRHADLVAVHVSDPFAQYAKLILKVSYNRGADLMACLAAVKLGQPQLPDRHQSRGHDRDRPRRPAQRPVPPGRRRIR